MSWICGRCDASVRDECFVCPACTPEAPREAPREALMSLVGSGASVAEARIDLEVQVAKATAPQRKYQYKDQDFNNFYALWPRKRSKEAALRAWEAALRGGASASAVIDGAAREAQRVKRLGIEMQHVPYPATWLNAAGWLDEDDSPPAAGETDPAFVVGTAEYAARMQAEEDAAIEAMG